MVALYDGGGALAALYDVGVDRPLRESVDMAYLPCLLLEDADELLSYYLSLLLRAPDAREL